MARRPRPPPGLALGGLLMGCVTPPAGDAARYLAASDREDAASCEAVRDLDLRGECLVFAAQALREAGELEGASAACTDLAPGIWRDECWFALSDGLGAQGTQAVSLCEQAGRFQDECRSHALTRRAEQTLAVQGQEELAARQVQAEALQLFGAVEGPGRARAALREGLAGRMAVVGLDPRRCGAAPADLCAAAYGDRVRQDAGALGLELSTLCPTLPSAQALAQAGLPPWSVEARPLAEQAWVELCGAPW